MGTKLNTTIKLVAIFAVASSLFACGDDSGSSSKANDDDNREVGTLAEMGRCTSEREGDTVYVAEKLTDYLCKNKSWVDLGEILDGETVQSSSSAAKGTSSSNAADSAQGFIRENISITGAAQKGPFKFGSPLKLRELRLRNDSLIYSGVEYVDEISSNKGDFVIPKVSLVYPYAELTVHGLWRNEVTGEWSKEAMTLQSLTDLSERTEANVNLLTHLEYERAKVLVNKGYSVSAAKKQADYEIMTAFGFATTIKFSEELSIFDDRDDNLWYDAANATLLAMSVLFMGDRSDSEISDAIESFRRDVAKDGEWNDEKTKAQMADWAQEFDNSKVRANVKSWNILEIPAFEEYMRIFWNNAYGLGGCASTRYGVVSPNTNKLSKNYAVHYICEAAGWRKATDYEKDTYGWDKGKEGDVKKGDVTATYYVFENDKWTIAKKETALGLCVGNRNGEIGKIDMTYYICKEKEWVLASVLEYDTYQFGKGNDGEVRPGKVNADNFYVYENGKWRVSASEIENNLGACVAGREGEVDKSGNIYYICKSKTWTKATALEYDTYGWKAGVEGEIKAGSVNASNYYVYKDGKWQIASDIEKDLGGCSAYREGEIGKSGNIYYICKAKAWTTATVLEYDTYGWNTGVEGEVRTGNVNTDKYYVYESGTWRTSAGEIENNLGACVTSREGEVGKSENTYYICKSKVWTTASALEYDTYGWKAGAEGEVKAGSVNANNYYIYKDGEWLIASGIEKDLGGCSTSREGEVGKSGNVYYICKSKTWKTATVLEYDTYGKICLTDGSIVNGEVVASNKYVCDAGKFRTATDLEILLDEGCVSYTEGNEIRKYLSESQDSVYFCNSSLWNAIMTDSRDGLTYKTVTIGTQIWMAENLNYAYTGVPYSYNGNTSDSISLCYNNDVSNCTKYGRLYTWAAAMDSVGIWSTNGKGCGCGVECTPTYPVRGVCPEGWHLPTQTEWNTLFTTVGGKSIAGEMLKSTSINGRDAYSFSALPAGYWFDGRRYFGENIYAYFWSSTEFYSSRAYMMLLDYNFAEAKLNYEFKYDGFSVRCIKD